MSNFFRRLFGQDTKSLPETASSMPSAPQDEAAIVTDQLPADVAVPTTQAAVNYAVDGATRPLPVETMIASANEHIIFGQSSDVGMVRSNNQDSALSFYFSIQSADSYPDFGLFIVADGMGGHHDGEKASAITARIVATQVTNTIYLPMVSGKDQEQPPISESLVDAVQKANATILSKVPDGGTTLSAVVVMGDLAYIAHVGDSRVYLITKDRIEQVTRDHSLVQRLIELDQLTPEEAAEHPQKNVLYRALGQNEALEVDSLTRRLPARARLLLCSDGLWSQVQDSEIAQIIHSTTNPQSACDQLVALANTRGGIDNVTAILLQVPG